MLRADFGKSGQQQLQPFLGVNARKEKGDLAVSSLRKMVEKNIRTGKVLERPGINRQRHDGRRRADARLLSFELLLFAGVVDGSGVAQKRLFDATKGDFF